MNERVQIPIRNMPADFLDSIIPRIKPFCVSLLHDSGLAGSGTLIQCGEKCGILTAYHVVYKGKRPFDFTYGSDDAIGLVIKETPHSLVIPLKFMVCHDIGIPVSEEMGPDLVFLEIPAGDKLGTLKATKSFVNLTVKSEDRIAFCESELGFWAMSYSIGEESSVVKMEDGMDAIVLRIWIGYTGLEKREQIGRFDFIEVGVEYTSENDLHESFGGASGGGLWKIPLSCRKRDNSHIDLEALEAGDPVLAGVLFYQTARQGNYRRIRCNGPESIYRILPQVVLG